MFIYNKDTQLNLIEYGISIPLLGRRGKLVFEYVIKNFPANKVFQGELKQCSKELLALAHSNEYINHIFSNPTQALLKTFELVNQDETYNRYNPESTTSSLEDLTSKILKQVSGTILTCETALKKHFSFHLGGGLHHAMTSEGRGFCLVNDLVIAARYMQRTYHLKNILIIDVDAHKGDGTAQITHSDPSITTFSIHMKNNWPLDTGTNDSPWFIPSDIDVPIDHKDNYLIKLKQGLDKLENYPTPQLCIVVQGSDPYEHDELESSNEINLSLEEMLERDKLVFHYLRDKKIPQAYVMAGGYGRKAHEPYIEFIKYLNNFFNS